MKRLILSLLLLFCAQSFAMNSEKSAPSTVYKNGVTVKFYRVESQDRRTIIIRYDGWRRVGKEYRDQVLTEDSKFHTQVIREKK